MIEAADINIFLLLIAPAMPRICCCMILLLWAAGGLIALVAAGDTSSMEGVGIVFFVVAALYFVSVLTMV